MNTTYSADTASVLTLGLEILKKHTGVRFIIGLILWVITTGSTFFYEQVIPTELLVQIQNNDFAGGFPRERLLSHLPELSLITIVMLILFLVVYIFSFKVALGYEKFSSKKIKKYVHQSFKLLGKYIGTNILQSICLFGLFLLLFIPGIIYSIYWLFTMLIVIDKKIYFWKAMKQSKSLVVGRRWKTFFTIIFLIIILMLANSIVSFIVIGGGGILLPSLVVEATLGIVSSLFQVITRVLVVSFYLNRKETSLDLSPTT